MTDRHWHALFVHVPPFEVIAADLQLVFAATLLHALASETHKQDTVPLLLQPALVRAVA